MQRLRVHMQWLYENLEIQLKSTILNFIKTIYFYGKPFARVAQNKFDN